MENLTQTGNLPQEQKNDTTSFFNNYFQDDVIASQFTDDAVVGFFESWTGNKDSAKTLSAAILRTAQQQGIDPMELIVEFRALQGDQLNAYLTLILNLNRVGTSLLGISNNPKQSQYITRAILA
jgi:hypothetical protein